MCIQFFQIWREHDVVCMWAVCVNVQTLENHPEMQYIIVCIYIYMHCISRHALSQTCIYMYMHGISHSGRGSGFQTRMSLEVRVIDEAHNPFRPMPIMGIDFPFPYVHCNICRSLAWVISNCVCSEFGSLLPNTLLPALHATRSPCHLHGDLRMLYFPTVPYKNGSAAVTKQQRLDVTA